MLRLVTPAIAWQTEEENTWVHNTYHWGTKGLNAVMADPLAPSMLEHPWQDLLQWDTDQ